MNELLDKIDEVCPEGRRKQHSYFQLQYFLIGKEPTIQARIQTCKQELLDRKEAIDSYLTSLEEALDKRRLEELRIEDIKETKEDSPLGEIEQIQIRQSKRRIKAIEYEIENFKTMIRGKEDEANFLLGLFHKLCELEEPKDWDSLEVQAEYWNARLTKEIEAQLLLGRSPDAETFKTVMALPEGMPIKSVTDKLIKQGQDGLNKELTNEENAAS